MTAILGGASLQEAALQRTNPWRRQIGGAKWHDADEDG